jgi:hypothetical protein
MECKYGLLREFDISNSGDMCLDGSINRPTECIISLTFQTIVAQFAVFDADDITIEDVLDNLEDFIKVIEHCTKPEFEDKDYVPGNSFTLFEKIFRLTSIHYPMF